MFKLNIHSIVDVITNSSTTIYTYQNSTKEAKELLQEILNFVGKGETVDDVFNIGVFLEDVDQYAEYLAEHIEEEGGECPDDFPKDWKEQGTYVKNLQDKILRGEMNKPQWMKDAEEYEDGMGYTYPTSLHIVSKDEKYSKLIEKILAFLNSTDNDAFRDG